MNLPETRKTFFKQLFIVCCIIFFSASWGLSNVRAQESSGTPPPLFSQQSSLRQADPSFVRDKQVTRFVSVDVNLDLVRLDDAIPVDENGERHDAITLNLFNDVTYVADFIRSEKTENGMIWIGKLRGVDLSQVVLSVTNGILAGNITMPSARYHIRYAGGGTYEVQAIDTSKFPKDHQDTPLIPPYIPGDVDQPLTDSCSQIDVMVVYSATTRTAAGGTAAMQSLIDLAVAETNQSYINSGINQRIRLVHTAEVSYTETGSLNDALSCITDKTDGCIDNVHALRDTYHADLVSFWVEDGGPYCGLAWLMDPVSSGFEVHGFSTVARSCATGYYSFGHELGHNMGARHDVYVDSTSSPYSYAHGFTHPQSGSAWRTIMAYNDACSSVGLNCTRLQYWSNPAETYGGVAMGDATTADNHRTLNNTACTVANFRVSSYLLSGTVHSLISLGPVVSGATVSIDGKTVTTDASGNFSIPYVASGTHTLTITKLGYYPYINNAYEITGDTTGRVFVLMPGSLPFNDGFESGNINSWHDDGGTYSREVTTENPAAGTYCFTQTGGTNSSHFNGISHTLPASRPGYISFYVKASTTTAASSYFVIGDENTTSNNGIIFFRFRDDGTLGVHDGSSFRSGGAYASDTWYRIEFKNINWTTKTYDFYVNGALKVSAIPFRSQATTSVMELYLYNYNNSQAWYDNISINSPATAVTLTPAPASPTSVGTPVTFTSAASGGSGQYQYRYLLKIPGGTLTTVRDYSTTATWNWTTTGLSAGTYQVVVHARNVGSTASYETYKSISHVLANPASSVTLTPSVASPTSVGTPVTFTSAASGGSGQYQYRYLLKIPGGTLTTVRDYSTTATWNWTTTGLSAGTYQVVVHARNVGSTASYETYKSVNYVLQ